MKITIHTNNIYKSVTTILVVAYFLAILCVRSGFPAIHHSCIFLAKKVPVSRKIYATIQSDAGFINQVAGQLFNYFSNPNPITEKIWYVALASGLAQSIIDANNLISKIPHGNPKGAELGVILNVFIEDCKAIEKIIPINE